MDAHGLRVRGDTEFAGGPVVGMLQLGFRLDGGSSCPSAMSGAHGYGMTRQRLCLVLCVENQQPIERRAEHGVRATPDR